MFERLIDLLITGWTRLAPAEIVQVYEGGVVLRLGKYQRTVGPGLVWKWPVIDTVFLANTVITTMRLLPQSLTTKDDVGVVIAAMVRYQITDVKPFVCEVYDQKDVLADISMGSIRRAVLKLTYKELVEGDPEATVTKLVRDSVNKFGFKIYQVTFLDLARVRSLRLIGGQPIKELDN